MVKLQLTLFNQRLDHLVNFNGEDQTVAWGKLLSSKFGWTIDSQEFRDYLVKVPTTFTYYTTQYENGDLIFFMPGIIHHVQDSLDDDTVRIKVSADLAESTTRTLDSDGFKYSDGSYKRAARDFEKQRLESGVVPDALISPLDIDPSGRDALKSLSAADVAFLKEQGMLIVRNALTSDYAGKLLRRSADYMKAILQLPQPLDLLVPEHCAALHKKEAERKTYGITNEMIRRQPDNTRSTIIGRDHGISGIGTGCKALAQMYKSALTPLLTDLYSQLYAAGGKHVISDVCIHLQGGA
jgi:hypothetical protein